MKNSAVFLIVFVVAFVTSSDVDWKKVRFADVFVRSGRNPKLNVLHERIVGGKEARDGQFPHQAGLLLEHEGFQAWCGGSLIAKRWVLTASHCVVDTIAAVVYLGAHNIQASSEVGRQTIQVTKDDFYMHSKWENTLSGNDISLIKLPVDARISPDIQIIALPSDASSFYTDEIAIASGWGRDSDNTNAISPVLRYVDLRIISNADCSSYFPTAIRDTNICTSGENKKSACNGDSGGPLIYEKNGKKVLIGLTSFGSSAGCEKNYPGAFTRVTSYLNWIKLTTGI